MKSLRSSIKINQLREVRNLYPSEFQQFVCITCKSMRANDPQGGAIFDPRGMLGRIYVKLHLDFQLNFNIHISNICKKASRQLNVLKRIGKHLCKLGKLNIYHSFILSNFNYCPLTWLFLWRD